MFEHSRSCAIAALPLAARGFCTSVMRSDGRFAHAPQLRLRLRDLFARSPVARCRSRTRRLKRPGL